MKEQIKEIQKQFGDSMDNWTSMILDMEIGFDKHNIVPPKYPDSLLMDMTVLFRHVLFNIGYHNKRINDENSFDCGHDLRRFIEQYTGVDSVEFFKKKQ